MLIWFKWILKSRYTELVVSEILEFVQLINLWLQIKERVLICNIHSHFGKVQVQIFLDLGWIYSWLTHLVVQSLLRLTPWNPRQTAACQASRSHTTINWKYLKSKMHAWPTEIIASLAYCKCSQNTFISFPHIRSKVKWPNKVSYKYMVLVFWML